MSKLSLRIKTTGASVFSDCPQLWVTPIEDAVYGIGKDWDYGKQLKLARNVVCGDKLIYTTEKVK